MVYHGTSRSALTTLNAVDASFSPAVFPFRSFVNGSSPHPMHATDPTGYTWSAGNPSTHIIRLAATSVNTSLNRVLWFGKGGLRYFTLKWSTFRSCSLFVSLLAYSDTDVSPFFAGFTTTLTPSTRIGSPFSP